MSGSSNCGRSVWGFFVIPTVVTPGKQPGSVILSQFGASIREFSLTNQIALKTRCNHVIVNFLQVFYTDYIANNSWDIVRSLIEKLYTCRNG